VTENVSSISIMIVQLRTKSHKHKRSRSRLRSSKTTCRWFHRGEFGYTA